MRRIPAVLAALALIVLTASPAAAAKPEKIPDVIGDPVVYPAGEICGFDLEYRVDIDDGKSIVFPATSDGNSGSSSAATSSRPSPTWRTIGAGPGTSPGRARSGTGRP